MNYFFFLSRNVFNQKFSIFRKTHFRTESKISSIFQRHFCFFFKASQQFRISNQFFFWKSFDFFFRWKAVIFFSNYFFFRFFIFATIFEDYINNNFRNKSYWNWKKNQIWNEFFKSKAIQFWKKWLRSQWNHFEFEFYSDSTSKIDEYNNDDFNSELTKTDFFEFFFVFEYQIWSRSEFQLNQILNFRKDWFFRFRRKNDRKNCFHDKSSCFLSKCLCVCRSIQKHDVFSKTKSFSYNHFSMFSR